MSNETFSVGEIAIVNCSGIPIHLSEVEIIGPAVMRKWRVYGGNGERDGFSYLTRDAAGQSWALRPEYLRKRRPPQDWVKLCELDNIPSEVAHV